MIRRWAPLTATAIVVAACAAAVLAWGRPGAGGQTPAAARPALDLDLVARTMGQPRPQRLAAWLHDLGVDPADRAALRRTLGAALPGQRASVRTLSALQAQNRELQELIAAADRALGPVAREHRRLGHLVPRVADLQHAVAQEQTALRRNVTALPTTLRRLRATMADLDGLAVAATPTVGDLGRTAPAVGRALDALRSFSRTGTTPLVDLGRTADQARSLLHDAAPLLDRTAALARAAAPIGRQTAALTGSLGDTGGFRRMLDAVYLQTLGINAYDDVGHYLRNRLVLSPCSVTARTATAACRTDRGGASSSSGTTGSDRALEAALLRRVLAGEPPAHALEGARDRPGARTLRRRISRDRRQRASARKRAERQAVTAGTSSASTRGQDAPIVVDGGLLPGAGAKGDG